MLNIKIRPDRANYVLRVKRHYVHLGGSPEPSLVILGDVEPSSWGRSYFARWSVTDPSSGDDLISQLPSLAAAREWVIEWVANHEENPRDPGDSSPE